MSDDATPARGDVRAEFYHTQHGSYDVTAMFAEIERLRAEVQALREDRELLDYMEQQGRAWSPAPMRAVRGTEWAVRAEHDIGDTATLREVLRISRSRAALRATPTPERGE